MRIRSLIASSLVALAMSATASFAATERNFTTQAFTQDEQAELLNDLQSMQITVNEDLAGLKRLVAQQFDIEARIGQAKATIIRDGRERQREREEPVTSVTGRHEVYERVRKETKVLTMPRRITTSAQLNALIEQLQELRVEIAYAEFNVTLAE